MFFLGVVANFLPVTGQARWYLCGLALIGAIVWFIGWLLAKDEAKHRENKPVTILGHTSGNIASAGRDVHQNIYHSPPDKQSSELADAMDELRGTYKEVSSLVTKYQLTGVSLPDINDVNRVRQRMGAAIRDKGLHGLVKANEFDELLQQASALEGDEEEEFLQVKTKFLDHGFLVGNTDTEIAIFDDLLNKQIRLKNQIERIESRSLS